MKKVILSLAAILMIAMSSCTVQDKDGSYPIGTSIGNPQVVVIDSCEYIKCGYGLTHKGNCKFCEERRRQEKEVLLEDIVIELY